MSSDRVALHRGTMQGAPAGPIDCATCLLTFHFVPREKRAAMVADIRRRSPGAPFVAVHLSVAGDGLAGKAKHSIAIPVYRGIRHLG